MIQELRVEIKGTSALLMNQFPMVPIVAIEKKSKEEQAEIGAYRVPGDEPLEERGLYVPGVCLQRALVSGGRYSKGKGRASLQGIIAAAVVISPERMMLGRTDYVIDSRAVVVPATKGRVIRHRPRIDEWIVQFQVDYDDTLLKEEQIREVIDNTGKLVGLLDYRPEKKGPFGRFIVTAWEKVKLDAKATKAAA